MATPGNISSLPEPMIISGPGNNVVTIHAPKTPGQELMVRARNMMLHLHVDVVVFEHKQTGQFLVAAEFNSPTDFTIWDYMAHVYFDKKILEPETSDIVGVTTELVKRPPRPPNMWILYRREKSQELRAKHWGITAGEVSMMVSRMWDDEHPVVKNYYRRLAQAEARRHKKKYPDYKYVAVKKSNAQRELETN